MHKLRWGVLSTAKIARVHVIPAIQSSRLGELVAIASRDVDGAQATAKQLGINHSYGSYEDLLADPDIDAIYNPLPNHLHVPWSLKALAAGKHVLVEKPVGLNLSEAQELLKASEDYPSLKVMEAFMYRFHPQWQQAKALLDEIGPLRNIQCEFSYNNRDANNIRNSAAMGGGALMDIGCYGISLARYLYGADPLRVLGHQQFWDYEVDVMTSALMEFEQGTASFSCSTKTQAGQWVVISGENGSVRLSIPFNPIADQPTQLVVNHNNEERLIEIAPANHYREMIDSFCLSVLESSALATPLTDAVSNMQVLDAIIKSADSNAWVPLN